METKNKIIFVTVDLLESAVTVPEQAIDLAKRTHVQLLLLGITDGRVDNDEERLAQLVNSTKARLEAEAIPVSGKTIHYEDLLDAAEEYKPLYIITTINSTRSIAKNVTRVLRESKYPVFVIHTGEAVVSYKKIVLPIDLTRESREKVSKGVELARLFDAEIHILSILTSSDVGAEGKLLAYSTQVVKFIEEHGVKAHLLSVTSNDIAKTVLNYVNEIQADLVLLTAKSEPGFVELFTGTSTERIVSEAAVSVLTVRPRERKDTTVFGMF